MLGTRCDMSHVLDVPILNEIAPGGFVIGGSYAVLCEPDSLWYDMSLAITSRALQNGLKTEYHTFQHTPQDVKRGLARLGVSQEIENPQLFRLIDTCTMLTGLPIQPEPLPRTHAVPQIAYKFNDPKNLDVWTEALAKLITEGCPESERKWLHVDDNTSVFNQYFGEKDLIKNFESRLVPAVRLTERVVLHSFLNHVASESFYKQFLAHCEGIFDLASREEEGRLENYIRARMIRGTDCDTRWRHVRLMSNGQIDLDRRNAKTKELGISRWLRGPRKE